MELAEAETAAILDIAPGTVKSRLHRALNHLQELIQREFPALQEEYEG
jgi:DNA-directed RNA polymerase specialized sigma24 family protein